MTVLLDNKGQGKVGDALAEGIQANAHISILSCLFSIYGYSALKKQFECADVLRLLIPSNDTPAASGNVKPFLVAGLTGSEVDRRFRNSLNMVEIARECSQWLQQKAEIRAVSVPVLQNLFHIENPDGSAMAVHGSSPFTSAGLGAVPSDGYEMNTCFTTAAETESLLKWFDAIWSNPEATGDIKSDVLTQLETIFANKSPELVYFLMLYNIFREYLGELEEDKIIKTRTGIKDTLVWGKLYRFQHDGVLGAIDKMEKYITAVSLPIALALEKRSKPWRLSSTTSCETTAFWFSAPRKFAKTGRFLLSMIRETFSLLIASITMCSITLVSPVNGDVPAKST